MIQIEEPLLTHIMPRSALTLDPGSKYLFGNGIEDRALLASNWRRTAEADGVTFVEVSETEGSIDLKFPGSSTEINFTGRRRAAAISFFQSNTSTYIDITGMSYSAWAPIVRAAVEARVIFRVIYVEPADYSRNPTPTRGMLFDLSEVFDGIKPIPGFATLRTRPGSDWHLVAALGFEGVRFSHVLNELEPAPDRVFSIVGVPGFRPEFAAQALIANRADLDDVTLADNIRYARANCPFDLFHTLRRIHDELDGSQLRLAPIGTKPHGLGAVLYTISSPANVQLIYDHPVRKAKRTFGESQVCVYDVSIFCESDMFRKPVSRLA